MEPTLDFDELSSALALKALANLGTGRVTITAQPDVAHPDTLDAIKWLGDELARAYLQGVTDGREGTPYAELDEAHEHEAARLASEAESKRTNDR
jgi:hypothetical protein